MRIVVHSDVAAPLTLSNCQSCCKRIADCRVDNGITSKLNIGDKNIMHGTTTTQFNCTNCNALYHLIKVEAGPETVDRNLNCQACGAPLPARDGQFVLKYFLLRKPSRP